MKTLFPNLLPNPLFKISSFIKISSFSLHIHKHPISSQSPKSSLYSHPTLLEMNKSKVSNRAKSYQFLRDLGISPNELDGLELPSTVEVLKERIDFLHSLNLTINDINNYPLVLGCSVKKNMIPVLDYLGKLGVKKSTFTDFLRRYPQVLHSSVVIDLIPVVNYLQGLDIKVNDIPRVLERYPEILGFKLEGTISTSVAYLIAIGVERRKLGEILTRYPQILGMRVGRTIKPFVDYVESIGLSKIDVARLLENYPHILGFNLEDQVKVNVNALIEFGVREDLVSSVIARYPDLLGIELREKLGCQSRFFESNWLASKDEFGRIIERMPKVVVLGSEVMLRHVEFFKRCGFSLKQVRKMVVGCPQLLALDMDVMRMSFEYFRMEMERELEDLVEFPTFFTYSLEMRIKLRHREVARKGMKCSLAWMLACSDSKFEERIKYESIGIEEMEVQPSFGMESSLEPRHEEDHDDDDDDVEYDDDDDDDVEYDDDDSDDDEFL